MIWIVVIFIFVVVFGYFKLPKKIKDFIGFIGLNFLGNTIPIWFILLINVIEKGLNMQIVIKSVHQPFTFLVLGGTLLSNTLFLWQKDFTNSTRKDISSLMLIYIFISLPLFGYLFVKTYDMKNKLVPTGIWIASYIVSLLAFLYYLKYQYKDFELEWINKNENNTIALEEKRKESYKDLKDSLQNFDDNE